MSNTDHAVLLGYLSHLPVPGGDVVPRAVDERDHDYRQCGLKNKGSWKRPPLVERDTGRGRPRQEAFLATCCFSLPPR